MNNNCQSNTTIFKIIFDRHVVYLRCDACSLDLPL